MNQHRIPSPAILVAVLALVAALAGTAVAQEATTSAVTKKKVKKIAKKQANKQIDARLPWGTNDIADGAVTRGKIADDAVNGGKIAADAVTSGKIAAGAVGSGKIAAGAIDTSKFANSIPAAHVTRTSDAPIPSASGGTKIAFDSERYDTANMHSGNIVLAPRLTAPVDGIYDVTAQVRWETDTGGTTRTLVLQKNDVSPIATEVESPPGTGVSFEIVTADVQLQAGDFVEVEVVQNSGSSLNVVKIPDDSPEFSMTWLAPGP